MGETRRKPSSSIDGKAAASIRFWRSERRLWRINVHDTRGLVLNA